VSVGVVFYVDTLLLVAVADQKGILLDTSQVLVVILKTEE
jgi:hypothetical protein